MQNAVRPAACPFGSHRSIDPEGTLPHLAWNMGVNASMDPFIALSFLALPVIPEIRITDLGVREVQ